MKKLWNTAMGLWKKYEEWINYLIWGFIAFVLSMVLFHVFANMMHMEELIANIIDWIICVIFTYITNRTFVFKSHTKGIAAISKEFIQFVSARLGTLALEEVILFVGIELLFVNNMLVKLIAQFLVIVSNYILSKLWIFKEK